MAPTVIIYGREDCKKCKSAKEKLNLMNLNYEVRDIDFYLTDHESWREDGSVDLQTFCALNQTNHLDLPVIFIDCENCEYKDRCELYHTYSSAMKKLKELVKQAA